MNVMVDLLAFFFFVSSVAARARRTIDNSTLRERQGRYSSRYVGRRTCGALADCEKRAVLDGPRQTSTVCSMR